MNRSSLIRIAAVAGMLVLAVPSTAQMPGRPGAGMGQSTLPAGDPQDMSTPAATEKSDVAARKAFKAAMKSLNKAKELDAAAARESNADKKAKAVDEYAQALDQFTEALSNKSDMVEAWSNVGYVHLRLGAFVEAVDDYNHALALKPDLYEATMYRGVAYLALDRLADAKTAYLELFDHARPLADQLMDVMQKWLSNHKADPRGMRPGDIAAFEKWLLERDAIAKQAPPPAH